MNASVRKQFLQRAFTLGGMSRDELFDVLQSYSPPPYVTCWPPRDVRAFIMEQDFPEVFR